MNTGKNFPERIFFPALLLAGILLGMGLGGFLLSPPTVSPSPAAKTASYSAITPAPAPVVGAPAPDFLLQDINGRAVQLSDLRGAPFVIAFWATWCEPCRLELPGLNKEASRVHVLAINYGEDHDLAAAYVKELELNALTILMDPDLSAGVHYRVNGLPTSFVVDSDGIIRLQKVGTLEISELDAALSALGGVS
jgi:thiol-disulfide isomerase/thioredoxin